jgi:hypothetical protein
MLALAAPALRADSLDAVLTRMDKSAKVFRSFEASVHITDYSDVFHEATEEDAELKMMKRQKNGPVLILDISGKNRRKIRMSGHDVEMYHPKANSVDQYDMNKLAKSADKLIFVGFGDSRSDLEKKYNISIGGSETIANVKTTRLDLTPKSEEAKKLFSMIQLWIPEDKGSPVQEKVVSGKDYRVFLYSNGKIRTTAEPALPESDFDLKLPPGVKRIIAAAFGSLVDSPVIGGAI